MADPDRYGAWARMRAEPLGAVHGSPADIIALLDRMTGGGAPSRSPGGERYAAAGTNHAIHAVRETGHRADGAGPFAPIPRWQFLLLHDGWERADDRARRLRDMLLPFTPSERPAVHALNPLVAATAARQRFRGALTETVVVIRDHMLLEKYNLVTALRGCGQRPERGVIVRKADMTRYGDRVAAQLSHDGFVVVPANEPLAVVADMVVRRARGRRTVVLDDGGDLAVAVARHRPGEVELIECTAKGAKELSAAGFADAFLDLSAASVKVSLHRAIAWSCVARFRQVLQHHRVAGARCAVVGFGRVGREVAALLTAMDVWVTVAEPRAAARQAARAAGYPAFRDCRAALASGPHGFVFGCSGVPAVAAGELLALTSPAVLVTVSSQDLQAAIVWLRTHARHEVVPGMGDRYTDRDGRTWDVLAHGHAINLFLSEGVSELEYDPFTALLLVAVVESARRGAAAVEVEELCADVSRMRGALS